MSGGPRGLVAVSLAGLLGACQTAGPDPAASPPVVPDAVVEAAGERWPLIDWAKATDCRAKLALLADAARAGRLSVDERPPIAVVLPGTADQRDWLAAPSVTVGADLPLAVHERDDPATVGTPCLLMLEPARDQRVGQRLLGRDRVRSLYESGVRSERNPDYDLAQVRLRKAERAAREEDAPGIMSIGDPLLDLVGMLIGGVVAGFSQGGRDRELDEAMTALATTPRSRDHPVYRAYEFERQIVLAGREATIPVALLDRFNRRVWRAELHRRERRELLILDGLDPRDKDYQQHSTASMTRHDFERWQREPPELQLSAIAAALSEADAEPATATSTAALALAQPVTAARPATVGSISPPAPAPGSAADRAWPPDDTPLSGDAFDPQWPPDDQPADDAFDPAEHRAWPQADDQQADDGFDLAGDRAWPQADDQHADDGFDPAEHRAWPQADDQHADDGFDPAGDRAWLHDDEQRVDVAFDPSAARAWPSDHPRPADAGFDPKGADDLFAKVDDRAVRFDEPGAHAASVAGGAAQIRPRREARPIGLEPGRAPRTALPRAASPEVAPPGAGPPTIPGQDPRAAGVVQVRAEGQDGSGVYVRADLVLTTAQLVAGSSVVDIATADGARVLGLVARADRARNLALLQVARPGLPAAFYEGPPIQPGRAIEALALADGAQVDLTPGRYRGAGPLSGLADPTFADLARVEVARAPAWPEGLPWFLGDRLIGVGTATPDGQAEGWLGVVGAPAILDFLYGAGGAVAGLR